MSIPQMLIVALVMMQLAIFATTIYLHRGLAHRALRFAPPFGLALRALIWLLTGMVPRQWVAIHRKHHHFTDVEGDPHSPMLLGFWKIQLGNVYFYRREARNAATIARYAPDLQPDRWDRWFFDRSFFGPAVTILLLTPFMGLGRAALTFGVAAVVYVLAAAGVNALGHSVGYKNFPNTATNLRLLALITGGEGLHNNHHARPGTARFAVRLGELDLGWYVIRALGALRLVEAVKSERPETAEQRRRVA